MKAVLLLVLGLISSSPVRAAMKQAPGRSAVHMEETQEEDLVSSEEDDEDDEDEEDGPGDSDLAAGETEATESASVAAVEIASNLPAGETGAAEDEEEGDASGLSASFTGQEKPGWGGWLDLRPSWSQSEFHSENELAVEYRHGANRSFGYTQEFRSNLLKAGVDSDNTGFEFQLWNGYLWGDFSNVLANRGGTLTLSYEPRIYLPTLSTERDAGLVFATRQYLKVNWEMFPNTSLYLHEVPIGYLYTVGGNQDDDGALANKVFENRVELGLKVSFFADVLTLHLPVILQSYRFRHFRAGAENDDRWAHDIWINPEITVAVAEKTTLGLAYYSDTLANSSLTEPDISNGLRKGIVQLILTQSI